MRQFHYARFCVKKCCQTWYRLVPPLKKYDVMVGIIFEAMFVIKKLTHFHAAVNYTTSACNPSLIN